MPASAAIAEPLPKRLAAQLEGLHGALDDEIPRKHAGRNLLIASWNLREFGGLTERWLSRKGDNPKRDLFSLRVIADIVSRFDVIAVQELQGSIKALRHLLRLLGPEWAFMLTDVTKGGRGQNERLAFLFDTRRLKPSGLACELVVPDDVLAKRPVKPDALQRQFARTPYAVSFMGSGQTFILVTLHVWFGKKPVERLAELGCIAEWLSGWAGEVSDFNQNLIALGDFNIDRTGDPNYEAFVSRGLSPPPELDGLPRTLPTKSSKPKFFDQIAWFHDEGRRKLTLDYRGRAGHFEFNKHVLTGLSRDDVSFRISDHYPLWVEFLVPSA